MADASTQVDLIARVLKGARIFVPDEHIDFLAVEFVAALVFEGVSFSQSKFLDDCGVKNGS